MVERERRGGEVSKRKIENGCQKSWQKLKGSICRATFIVSGGGKQGIVGQKGGRDG